MNKHGLTLIEVIIAALVLAIAVGGVLYIFSTEKGTIAWTGRRVQAMDFGRQTLERLKNEVGADTWTTTAFVDGTYTDQDLDAASEFKTKFPWGGNPANTMREYTISTVPGIPPANGYKQVSVTIRWEEPAEPQ